MSIFHIVTMLENLSIESQSYTYVLIQTEDLCLAKEEEVQSCIEIEV